VLIKVSFLLLFFLLPLDATRAQGSVAVFQQGKLTLARHDPATQASATTIPVVPIPLTLAFDGKKSLDAAPDVPRILHSPVFSKFPFPAGGNTQFADALLRATIPQSLADTPSLPDPRSSRCRSPSLPVKATS
jgi:chitinase